MKRLLAAIVLGVSVFLGGMGVQAHMLERTVEWTVDDRGAVSEPSCSVEFVPIGNIDDISYYDIGRVNDIEAELCSTDHTGSRCESISLSSMNSEYVALAQEVMDAEEVYLQLTERGTEEISFAENVMDGLRQQWTDHWCGADGCRNDALLDKEGNPIVFYHTHYRNGVTLAHPPMRSAERSAVAQCLLNGYSVTQHFERRDYLISGPVNIPKL